MLSEKHYHFSYFGKYIILASVLHSLNEPKVVMPSSYIARKRILCIVSVKRYRWWCYDVV